MSISRDPLSFNLENFSSEEQQRFESIYEKMRALSNNVSFSIRPFSDVKVVPPTNPEIAINGWENLVGNAVMKILKSRKDLKIDIKQGTGKFVPLTDQERRYHDFRAYQMSGSIDSKTTFEEFVELDNLIQGAMNSGE